MSCVVFEGGGGVGGGGTGTPHSLFFWASFSSTFLLFLLGLFVCSIKQRRNLFVLANGCLFVTALFCFPFFFFYKIIISLHTEQENL